MKKEIANV